MVQFFSDHFQDHDQALIILKIKLIHGIKNFLFYRSNFPEHFLMSYSYILTTLLGPRGPQSHKSQKLNITKINFSEFIL